jgi:hypothetical protein
MAEHFAEGRLPAGVSIGFVGTAAGAAAVPVEPVARQVGTLHVQHFRGAPEMENLEYVPLVDLPPGSHPLFASPQLPASLSQARIDALVYASREADEGPTGLVRRALAAVSQAQLPELSDEQILSIAAGPWWSEDGIDPVPFARAVLAAAVKA